MMNFRSRLQVCSSTKAEDVTRRRLFLEMIELVLPDAKKVIIEDSPESSGKTVIIK